MLNELNVCEKGCLPGNVFVLTREGPMQVENLVGKVTYLVMNGEVREVQKGFVSKGKRPVYRLYTKEGFSLMLTHDQRIAVLTKSKNNPVRYKSAQDVKIGEKILINSHGNFSWKGEMTEKEGYIAGLYFLSNMKGNNDNSNIRVWLGFEKMDGVDVVLNKIKKTIQDCLPKGDKLEVIYDDEYDEYVFKSEFITNLIRKLEIENKIMNKNVVCSSSDFYRGFLSGIFDVRGTVKTDKNDRHFIKVVLNNGGVLYEVQRMLLRMGIHSKVFEKFRKDSEKEKIVYELYIHGKNNIARFANIVNVSLDSKKSQLQSIVSNNTNLNRKDRFFAVFSGLEYVGEMEVYSLAESEEKIPMDASGFVVLGR